MIYRCLLLQTRGWFLDRAQTEGLVAMQYPIHTEILRVNRQIHVEASSVLYSELVILICPGEIACLRGDSKDLAKPTKNIWRHDPLYGIGSPGPHGGRVYSTPELDGKLEPHVFSRFTHLSLELYLEFCPGEFPRYQPMSIDSGLNINPKHRTKFIKFLRRTNIIRDFVTIISNSPRIHHLYITLQIRAMPDKNEELHNAEGELPDFYFMAVDTRAVEYFLESHVMDHLIELANVDLAFLDVVRPWDGERQKLQPKYQKMLQELEIDIEMNWAEDDWEEIQTGEDDLEGDISSDSDSNDSAEDRSENDAGSDE